MSGGSPGGAGGMLQGLAAGMPGGNIGMGHQNRTALLQAEQASSAQQALRGQHTGGGALLFRASFHSTLGYRTSAILYSLALLAHPPQLAQPDRHRGRRWTHGCCASTPMPMCAICGRLVAEGVQARMSPSETQARGLARERPRLDECTLPLTIGLPRFQSC